MLHCTLYLIHPVFHDTCIWQEMNTRRTHTVCTIQVQSALMARQTSPQLFTVACSYLIGNYYKYILWRESALKCSLLTSPSLLTSKKKTKKKKKKKHTHTHTPTHKKKPRKKRRLVLEWLIIWNHCLLLDFVLSFGISFVKIVIFQWASQCLSITCL